MPYKDYERQLEANRRSYQRNQAARVQRKREFREKNLLLTRRQKRDSMVRLQRGEHRLGDPRVAESYLKYARLQRCKDQHRRKARRYAAEGYCSLAQLQARIDFYGGLCYLCGAEADTIDHVIPLARGGTEWPSNLRPACHSCNSSKGAKCIIR